MATPNLLTLTTVTPKVLASAQLASGDTTVYTVAANKAAKLGTVTLCNVSNATVVVTVGLVPSGGVVDGTHRVISAYPLGAGDSIPVNELVGAWMGQGDSLVVSPAVVGAVDVTVTGLEFA